MAAIHRLTFILPVRLAFAVPAGRHHPCLAGCILTVDRNARVEVLGPSRAAVFDQASRWLRGISKGVDPLAIAAVLETPRGPDMSPGRDGWSIIIGAAVAFSPTTIEPWLPHDRPAPAKGVASNV